MGEKLLYRTHLRVCRARNTSDFARAAPRRRRSRAQRARHDAAAARGSVRRRGRGRAGLSDGDRGAGVQLPPIQRLPRGAPHPPPALRRSDATTTSEDFESRPSRSIVGSIGRLPASPPPSVHPASLASPLTTSHPHPIARHRAHRHRRADADAVQRGSATAPRAVQESRPERRQGPRRGAFYLTLVPIRPRSRGERRFLRTFASASLRPGSLAFNPRPRRLSTPTDAFQLHPWNDPQCSPAAGSTRSTFPKARRPTSSARISTRSRSRS